MYEQFKIQYTYNNLWVDEQQIQQLATHRWVNKEFIIFFLVYLYDITVFVHLICSVLR